MRHHFGRFTYDDAGRELARDGAPISLNPKLLDTLHVLLERRGRVVSKAELMRLVWPDTAVEETGLARNISLLRKALGDESEEFIETVPKRGYRFAAAPAGTAPPSARWRRVGIGVAAALVAGVIYWQFFLPGRFLPRGGEAAAQVAILPFETLAGTAPPGFARGLQELLAAEFSVGAVRVLSPSTVQRYRRVPPQIMTRILGLDAVVEGTIQVEGSVLRVTSRLADVHTGKLIAAKAYDLPAGDLAGAQRDLARGIAADLLPHLHRR